MRKINTKAGVEKMRFIAFLITISLTVLLASACASTNQAAQRLDTPSQPTREVTPDKLLDSSKGDVSGGGELSRQSGVGDATKATDSNGERIDRSGSTGAGVDLPEGWPPDATVMPGFTLTVSMNKGDGGLQVGAVGSVKVADALEFYRKLPGWNVVTDSITTPGTAKQAHAIILSRGNGNLNVYIESDKAGTHLNLTYKVTG
jgi:hypothetical protein